MARKAKQLLLEAAPQCRRKSGGAPPKFRPIRDQRMRPQIFAPEIAASQAASHAREYRSGAAPPASATRGICIDCFAC